MMSFYEFVALNRSKGFRWFDQDTKRFFKSRINMRSWDCITGYFISSEAGPSGVRKWSIRKANFETGNVDTIGEFQAYNSLDSAKRALKRIQRGKVAA